MTMMIGEVCLLTSDVLRLANFYKALLYVEDDCTDTVHQVILHEGTTLTIYNDGQHRDGHDHSIQLAFTVDDVEKEQERLLGLGVTIVTPPTKQPWGATNMSFLDPDGHLVFFRSLPKEESISGTHSS